MKNYFKNKLGEIARDTVNEFHEVSKEISWNLQNSVENTKRKVRASDLPKRVSAFHFPSRKNSDQIAYEHFRYRIETEIYTTYLKEGGYRYYALSLLNYVQSDMIHEHDLHTIWTYAYNSHLEPMQQQWQKLNQKILQLCEEKGGMHPRPENAELMKAMAIFSKRACEDNLHNIDQWEKETYCQALKNYVDALDKELLKVFEFDTTN